MTKQEPGLVEQTEDGRWAFGEGQLDGWTFQRVAGAGRESTLRNAILAALYAEAAGQISKAHAIWTYDLGGGLTVARAVADSLDAHVTALQAGLYTMTKAEVQAELDRLSATIGHRPALAHWEEGSKKVCLWTWGAAPLQTWVAVEFATNERARLLQVRPVEAAPAGRRFRHLGTAPQASEADVERLSGLGTVPCSEVHARGALGGRLEEEHTLAECGGTPMAEKLGDDLPWGKTGKAGEPSAGDGHVDPGKDAAYAPKPGQATGTTYGGDTPGPRPAEPAPSAPGADSPASLGDWVNAPLWPDAVEGDVFRLTNAQADGDPKRLKSPQILFCLQVDARRVHAQRKCKTYRACEICRRAVACYPDRAAPSYVTITGRRRAHVACAREAIQHVNRLMLLQVSSG